MKKLIVAILAFLYLGVSSGVAMEIHYCMGKKAGVEFYGHDNGKCGKCGMTEKKNGCCSDEHKFYKLEDAHKNISNNLSFETPVFNFVTTYPDFSNLFVENIAFKTIQHHSPPDYTEPSTCIMNCIFRL